MDTHEHPASQCAQYADYWVIVGEFGVFSVSRPIARRVIEQLDRFWVPRWIRFTDLVGSRVRVRARDIQSVYEWTERQRVRARQQGRAREREENADRSPWED
jgi:hypothetical protein